MHSIPAHLAARRFAPPGVGVVPVPTGVNHLGLPTYGPLPGGVPNPPNAWAEAQELQLVRALNQRAIANPEALRFTETLTEKGGFGIWMDMAGQYRSQVGLLRGLAGTALMLGAMGVASLRSGSAKRGYRRLHPHQLDPSIQPIGKQPKGKSYPASIASTSAAAATVLAHLWPARSREFLWWARQAGLAGVHSGAHFPSDVRAGAALGQKAGFQVASILY